MSTAPTITDAAAMLERLSAAEVEARLLEVRAEERSLRTLLRTLRARDTSLRKRERLHGRTEGPSLG